MTKIFKSSTSSNGWKLPKYQKKKKIELFHFQKAKLISMYRKKKLKYLNYIFPESS